MKFTVITLGCKVNSFESMSYVESFKKAGYTLVNENDVADIYIINSCAVTNAAARKTRSRVNRAHRLNKDALIVLVGCYAQVEADLLLENQKIDLLVGSNQKANLTSLVKQVLKGKHVLAVDIEERDFEYETLPISNFENQKRAFLKVQDGCDQFCAYCIIPFARGKERSEDLDVIISNAKFLVSNDSKEIVLSGIHTGRYGKGLDLTLYDLMQALLIKVAGIERLRVSSIEVLEINANIIQLAKDNDVIANHWHIPLQSGSNKILKLMNRRYTSLDYKDKILEIRSKLPNVAISADVIVGYPSETDEDFLETYNFIKDLGLSFLHVFPYSPKSGTPAAQMPDQVNGNVKRERVRKLLELSMILKNNYMQTFINKKVRVLVEGMTNGYYKGYCSEYFEVRFKSDKKIDNEFVDVIVESIEGEVSYGRRL